MSEHDKDTEFLKQCILYDDSAERHRLEESMAQLQRDQRSVRRAVVLMVVLAAVAMAGVCYAAVLLVDDPQDMRQLTTLFIVKASCALGAGSMICMLTFGGLGVAYRKELDQRREECRRLATRFLESRLGGRKVFRPPGE